MLHRQIPMIIYSPNIMLSIQNKINATYIYKHKYYAYATYTTPITYATHTKLSLY